MLIRTAVCSLSRRLAFTSAAAVLASSNVAAESRSSADGLWKNAEQVHIAGRANQRALPSAYRLVQADLEALRRLAAAAPLEFTTAARRTAAQVTIPLPDGSFARFAIVHSPIMEAALAARTPEVSTYRGVGLDDPSMSVRFDITPAGFYALVLTPSGAVRVAPVQTNSGETASISYYLRDDPIENRAFHCAVTEVLEEHGEAQTAAPDYIVRGGTLTIYRLAAAATGEYTAQNGGTVASAQTQIATNVNAINAILEREMSIRFTLVGNNTAVIYTDPNTDPYTTQNRENLVDENQANLTSTIGAANFDIGIVFDATAANGSAAGLAALGATCNNSRKGRATTGGNSVLLATHELGHVLGASHTHNGTSGICGGQRSAPSAVEPGSGSTIMSYAGTCGASNLQLSRDEFFHANSLGQMNTYGADGGAGCGTRVATGNSIIEPPSPGTLYIPKATPFELNAGQIADPEGDQLTHSWEQLNTGAASPPEGDDGSRPIFRSYAPKAASSRRMFPSLQYVLNDGNNPPATYPCGTDTCVVGESLPVTARTLHFTITLRDGRGGLALAGWAVEVRPEMGPFQALLPLPGDIWRPEPQRLVEWAVANTTAAPVGAAEVKISLSTDGGNSFPHVLAENTPNDGTERLIVPCVSTSSARVKVESVGNDYIKFFDVTDANFTIAPQLQVTQPNQYVAWTQRTRKTVTWSRSTGCGADRVKISLSTNGGATFPIVLAADTANDGTQMIIVPEVETDYAVIKIESLTLSGVADVSDTPFRIKPLAVTNANDSGEGSLREAIDDANNTVRDNQLEFSVRVPFRLPGGAVVHTIHLQSQLPPLIGAATLDGWTQGGAGYSGPPLIELNGSGAAPGPNNAPANGLVVRRPFSLGDQTLVRGIVINRFAGSGVVVEPNGAPLLAGHLVIEHCRFGTDVAGTAALGNAQSGVFVSHAGQNGIGSTIVRHSLISGNQFGVTLAGGDGTGTEISSNFIGTDASGAARLGNTLDGIRINSSSNNLVAGNVISGNGDDSNTNVDGIEINGSSSASNVVRGNIIGLSAAGNARLRNRGYGVHINGGIGNVIGGTEAGAGNVITGNGSAEVAAAESTPGSGTGNIFEGNIIGLNPAGTAKFPNPVPGMLIMSGNNFIGGPTPGAGNVISGNTVGVFLDEPAASGTSIRGNYIGTDATGSIDLGNNSDGIFIERARNVTIGGTDAGARNVISGNDGAGLNIVGTSTDLSAITIHGNYIGTNTNGNAALGNERGVNLANVRGVQLGGTIAGARNVISANAGNGVRVLTNFFHDLSAMRIEGNFIGTDAAGGAALPNSGDGVQLILNGGSAGLTIGGTAAGAGNVISANAQNGLTISGAPVKVQGNILGTSSGGTVPLGNGRSGVVVESGNGSTIGGVAAGEPNLIAFNGAPGSGFSFAGVKIIDGTGHQVRGNSIVSNAGLGLNHSSFGVRPNDDCDGDTGSNNFQNHPVLTSAVSTGNAVTVNGTLNSTPNSQFVLDFYSSSTCDSSGRGEGAVYLGTALVNTGGSCAVTYRFVFPARVAAGHVVTATATDAAGNTSEFSSCRAVVAGPTILSFLPTRGMPGQGVTIAGTGFTGIEQVTFNGVPATFAVDSDTEINAIVPPGAATGTISVSNAEVTASSVDDFVVLADNDGDGLPDEWEQLHFGTPTAGNPSGDDDRDGFTNLQEFIAGTNPLNASSRLAIQSIRRQGVDVVITFRAPASKRFRLESADSLGVEFSTQGAVIPRGATERTVEVIDPGGAQQPRRIYRVVVLP